MRRSVSIVAVLLCAAVVALSQSTTPNLQLQLPNYQAPNWNLTVNQNFQTLDQTIGTLQVPYAGAWSSTIVYSRGQQVQYNSALYASLINANFGNTPSSSPLAWMTLPSGTASFPGVTTNGSNGLNISGAVATAQVTAGSAISGHRFTLTNLGTIASDWTADATSPSTFLSSLAPGVTPDGNSGIGIANKITSQFAFHVGDSPGKNTASNTNDFNYFRCTNEYNTGLTGGSAGWQGYTHTCANMSAVYSAPGIDLGTTSGNAGQHGPGGWSLQTGLPINTTENSPGISNPSGGTNYKAGIGDTAGQYIYNWNYNGFIAGSDEGLHLTAAGGGEIGSSYAGNVATSGGGSGATSIKVNCTSDCADPGDGRYLLDKSATQACNVTAQTAATSLQPGTYTVDCTVTPSTAWGTLHADVMTPTNSTGYLGVGSTNMTFQIDATSFNGNASPGNFTAGSEVCFNGAFHEQAIITSVTGTGPWTVTVPLRHAHPVSTWVMQGACQTIVFNANTVQGLEYPFDIIGAIDSHTLAFWFFSTSTPVSPTSGTQVRFADTGNAASASGSVITFTNFFASQRPYLIGRSLNLSGASDSTYNGTCTGAAVTTAGLVQCTISGTPGASATGITISIGTTQYGNTAVTLGCGAEVLDVQDYTTTPPSVSPTVGSNKVTSFTVEPNNCAWPNAGAVTQPHHAAAKHDMQHMFVQEFDPYSASIDGVTYSLVGNFHGGSSVLGQGFYTAAYTNSGSTNQYQYHGGSLSAPGGIYLGGLMNSGLNMQYAPDAIGANVINVGCPNSGCTDQAFTYNLFTLAGQGSNAIATYTPYTRSIAYNVGFLDFNSAPIMRPTIKSFANNSAAVLTFNSLDSGAASHTWTISAPTTGGGFTLTLPQATGTLALNSVFGAAGASHATGLVPDPGSSADATKYLRDDATWQTVPIPAVFGASGASHSTGLVPDPGSSAGSTRYLREDGTWQTPSGSGAFPIVVAHAALTAQTAGVNPVVTYTPVSDGTFRVSAYIYVTTACTSGNIGVTTQAFPVSGHAANVMVLNPACSSAFSGTTGTASFHAAGGQVITGYTSFNSVVGSPAYMIDIVIEQIN